MTGNKILDFSISLINYNDASSQNSFVAYYGINLAY